MSMLQNLLGRPFCETPSALCSLPGSPGPCRYNHSSAFVGVNPLVARGFPRLLSLPRPLQTAGGFRG